MVKIPLISGKQLSTDMLSQWSQLQQSNATLDSPFFRPEYTQQVATVCDDVEVAVLEDAGRVVGFFPFQRGRWNFGRPVGGRLTDLQGIIASPQTRCDAADLIRACRLRSWDFDNLLASQPTLKPFHHTTSPSLYIDLSNGIDAYCAERRAAGSKIVKRTHRKARKIEREVGPLRFEFHTRQQEVYQALLRWKSEQYVRTNATDVFEFPWTVALLDDLLVRSEDTNDTEFSAVLSALYAGDHLVAAHYGIRSRTVLNLWFAAYNLAVGHVEWQRVLHAVRTGWNHVRDYVRTSSFATPARTLTRSLRGWAALR